MADLSRWGQVILASGWLTEETWLDVAKRYQDFLAENPGFDFSLTDYLLQFDYLTEQQCESLSAQVAGGEISESESDREFGQVVIDFDDADDEELMVKPVEGNAHAHPQAKKDRDFELPEEEMIDLADESDHVEVTKSLHPDAVSLSTQARDELMQQGNIEQLDLAAEDEDPAGVRSKWKYDDEGQFVQSEGSGSPIEHDFASKTEEVKPAPFIEDDDEAPLELNVDPEEVAGYEGRMSAVDWVDSNETDQSEYKTDESEQIDLD